MMLFALLTSGIFMFISLAIGILLIVAMWRIFSKAGKPGWASLIPFYNTYVMLTIAGKPGWWLVLFFIPIVNLVISILALVALAKTFGKGGGFVVGLIFLPIIFWPILAFDSSKYTAPIAA